jgi:hypothetical protein
LASRYIGRRSLIERASQTLKRFTMDDEEPAQLVLRQRLGSGKLSEAGTGVKAADALIQVVQHFEMDTLKHGSDLGFATPDEHGCHPHSEIKSDIVLLKRFLTLQPFKPTQQQLDVLG